MAKYDITINGETFEVESARPLTDAQAYNAALPEYQKLRGQQVEQEEAGRAMGGQYKIGAEGLPQAARAVAESYAPGWRSGGRAAANAALGMHTLWEGLQPIVTASPARFAYRSAQAALRGEPQPKFFEGPSAEELQQSRTIKEQ